MIRRIVEALALVFSLVGCSQLEAITPIEAALMRAGIVEVQPCSARWCGVGPLVSGTGSLEWQLRYDRSTLHISNWRAVYGTASFRLSDDANCADITVDVNVYYPPSSTWFVDDCEVRE